jgi:hypothetical protein
MTFGIKAMRTLIRTLIIANFVNRWYNEELSQLSRSWNTAKMIDCIFKLFLFVLLFPPHEDETYIFLRQKQFP